MRALFTPTVATALIFGLTGAARAEPVQITSGALVWTLADGPPEITLAGENFTFTGVGLTGFFSPYETCLVPECSGGTTLDLRAIWVDADLPGTATYDGRTFDPVGGLAADASLQAIWDGTLTIPQGFTSGEVSAPFQFSGLFFHSVNDPGLAGRVDLFGAGTATLTFRPYAAFPGALQLTDVRYEFGADPVPEPASMILLGTGLAGMAALRRRIRQR